MNEKIKHLEFIQGIINRMANDSFLLKGWSVTLLTVLFVFTVKEIENFNFLYVLIIIFPIFIFWILDGYFLSQERRFRDLYEHVRKLDEKNIDFSMDTIKYKDTPRNTWWGSIRSSTLLWFYIPLAVIVLIVLFSINK